ncbi:hypothetical protein DW192_00910 [Segatella copri]|uniref:Uncharacterized protein n=2 Tax=Segatella copri TaxID=165179 RepID=A0A3R6IBL2_9BACT|nr:hypothetical protein DW192_00910 [Segatella copri]
MYKIEERILTDSNMKASELIEHLKSYIDITGGDCEMLVFDKAEGVSCDINDTTSDGDYVFLHISSDKYTTKTPE